MIRIATRSSALAVTQARQVAKLLGVTALVEVSSDGEPGDKARFVRGVERALLEGKADIGVHSAKDLPGELPDGLVIAAVPAREDPADVWIGAGSSLDEASEDARVGTASLRRRAQLLAARPDLRVSELHGNVDTRLRRLAEGELDAIVLAAAGLRRLGREAEASFAIPAELMTPAAGQGALVLQARAGDTTSIEAAAGIGDGTALRELTAERAAVALLEASCTTPIGVHARIVRARAEAEQQRVDADRTISGDIGAKSSSRPEGELGGVSEILVVDAFVGLPDGSEWIRDRVEGEAEEQAAVGVALAERLLAAGARDILDRAESWTG